MPRSPVYLDHAATTPVDPRVLEGMLPHFSQTHGDPSSVHTFGPQAEAAVESARADVATILGCSPSELVFTACGSVSDNLALRGAAFAERQLQRHFGFQPDWLPVDPYGRISPDDLREKLSRSTAVVSIVYANNKIGTANPIAALAAECRAIGVPFHTDALQAASQLPVDVGTLGVDLLALGARKFYGPKGVGALNVKDGLALLPWLTGGSQEHGLRAGTHNVPLIVDLAEAFQLTSRERDQRNAPMAALRDRIIRSVLAHVPDSHPTGHPTECLPNHASFVFRGVVGNRCWPRSISKVPPARQGPPASPALPNPRRSGWRSGCRLRWRWARCASPSGRTPAPKTLTASSTCCLRSSRESVERHPLRHE